MSSSKENFSSVMGVRELRNYKLLISQLFAELLGTFLFLVMSLSATSQIKFGPLSTAFANGLIIASIIQIIGHVSGGHINPAVTFACMINGEIKVLRALLYVVVQIVGSIAGAAVAYALLEPSPKENLGVIWPQKSLKTEHIFFFEFLQTFIMTAVFCSVIDSKRGAKGLGSAALAIGLAVTACQCSCLNFTSCLNPVRALGPAVMADFWRHHWVYWLAPILGGMCAGFVYKCLLIKKQVFIEI